ncbi:hypothetical protein ACHFJ0_22085 [Paracoccus sp. NGMCC 1.201697]|uniref:Mobilization protein n=1 Tax=Paracoccus broussonetiae subsp. drimophilus TaxID=3373869 RepID=A0ABW7LUR7_9RHOB
MAETELERAEKRYAQAKARLQALKNREAAKERKLDTRRKVILGGALIDLAARDSNAAAMLDRLIRNLPREQDRVTFAGWNVRTAAMGPAGDTKDDAGCGSATQVDAVPADRADETDAREGTNTDDSGAAGAGGAAAAGLHDPNQQYRDRLQRLASGMRDQKGDGGRQ